MLLILLEVTKLLHLRLFLHVHLAIASFIPRLGFLGQEHVHWFTLQLLDIRGAVTLLIATFPGVREVFVFGTGLFFLGLSLLLLGLVHAVSIKISLIDETMWIALRLIAKKLSFAFLQLFGVHITINIALSGLCWLTRVVRGLVKYLVFGLTFALFLSFLSFLSTDWNKNRRLVRARLVSCLCRLVHLLFAFFHL